MLKASLPSLTWSAERTQALMGEDFWPYGLDANARTLEVFLRYHFERGLSQCRLAPNETVRSQHHLAMEDLSARRRRL